MKNKRFDEKKYPKSELTQQLIGFAYAIYRELGYGLPERVYQRAFSKCLAENKLTFSREKYGKIIFGGAIVGKYFLDFLVEQSVAVEMKVRNSIYETDKIQLLNYIKSENLPVGLLIVFSKKGLCLKRLANTCQR